jgi:uncharacterized protein with von Willebrand factor type A (vWA) domain
MPATEGLPGFARMLRAYGLRVTTGQVLDLTRALAEIDITDQTLFYVTSRALLLTRHADEPLFAALFGQYWQDLAPLRRELGPPGSATEAQTAAEGEGAEAESAPTVRVLVDDAEAGAQETEQEGEPGANDQVALYSATELLRRKDFGELTSDELAEVRRLIAELRWRPATRKLRRTRRASKGPHPDPRRAFRESLAHGGEILELPRRVPRRKPRSLVLLCDVSGSMARYTSVLLRFLHALRQGRGAVETFVFGTRLTRITHQLRARDTDQAIAAVAGEVLDWGGGTRIGESLATFNRVWGRRVLGHDAVVVIISDGWDRGDPGQLAQELAHLQRLAHRLVWLNPLLGLAGYRPLTRGMRAAMPFIDDFLAAHNLQSLEALAAFLHDLDEYRPERVHAPASENAVHNYRGNAGG